MDAKQLGRIYPSGRQPKGQALRSLRSGDDRASRGQAAIRAAHISYFGSSQPAWRQGRMSVNTWTLSGWGREQHEKVKAAAKAGNYGEALRCLQSFGVYAGIASCVDLAATDRATFETLAAKA